MKTLSDLKRTVKQGSKLTMTRHDWYPSGALVGIERTVSKTQGNAIVLRHPDIGQESWLYMDSAKHFIFDGSDSFSVILNPDIADSPPLMSYKLVH